MSRDHLITLIFILFVAASAAAVEPATLLPNSDPVYQQVRRPAIGDAYTVQNVTLKRDAGLFTLQSGTLCFTQPMNGKVTGAVFTGSGSFSMTPPTPGERKSLSYLTKEQSINEQFEELTLRFGDDTYDVLRNAAGLTKASGGCAARLFDDALDVQKKKVHYNLAGRILQDVLSSQPGGLFMAFIKGKRYNGKLLFIIDPHGVRDVTINIAPEEVMLMTYDENKFGVWSSFHLEREYADGTAVSTQRNGWVRVDKQVVDVEFEKSGKLTAKAVTTFTAAATGLRVLPLTLYPTLRVTSVTDGSGAPLNFIQESKDDDPDFFVILPKTLNAGETYTVTTSYSGKDAVQNEGSGNYYVSGGARTSWYPNSSQTDYTQFELRFAYPKDLDLIATGNRVSEKTENGRKIAEWKTDAGQTVACFQIGKVKRQQKTLKEPKDFEIEAYANTEIPDSLRGLKQQAETPARLDGPKMSLDFTGGFDTSSSMQKAMAEAELAAKIYTEYFGPTPFKRLAITQQVASSYGQSFPGLIWLPLTYFYDDTVRHQLEGFDPKGYFRVVGPHEIAHQWWGHTVTWASYRDQWMSEGFAELSASIFLQAVHTNKFISFWNDERELLTEKNRDGYRAIDVGPLTMGYRLANSKTGFDVPRHLIYPKGGYVLHMIRMMMWSPREGDKRFKELMRDFVQTYYNKPASTEDFKAMVEKHLPPGLDFDGNGKIDWFFDEYVYGTALPNYKLAYDFGQGNGGLTLNLHITQSNVHDSFKMIVPVYLELANGRILRLGQSGIVGNTTKNESVELGKIGLKEQPKRVLLNYYNDVLSTMN